MKRCECHAPSVGTPDDMAPGRRGAACGSSRGRGANCLCRWSSASRDRSCMPPRARSTHPTDRTRFGQGSACGTLRVPIDPVVSGGPTVTVMVLAYDDVRNLPLPDLSLRLLQSLGAEPNFNNLIQGFRQREGYGTPQPSDMNVMLARLSDAWAWLESHALVGPSAQNPPGGWQRVTSAGAEVASDPNAVAKVWAADRLAGDLHPALSSARSNFALGDYETASFAAMKAVEVEVRRVAGLPNELLGVNLMRKAFSSKDGVLRDPGAEGGEQQATADLFAGAIGAYKNPASHRAVKFDDPVEAAEVLQLADLLLRIVQRAEARLQM